MATKAHFQETHRALKKINKDDIFEWLMKYGYFPESYVLPPFFKVAEFNLGKKELFKTKPGKKDPQIDLHELAKISYPKNHLTDITFGIINPDIYHDISYWMHADWGFILKHLFEGKRSIYSYSFPVPINTVENSVTNLRAERMIYEYIEGAEHDLLIDGINHTHVVQVDIKNFYPSIYTHSICWALSKSRKKDSKTSQRGFHKSTGNKLDELLQKANDRQTNGVPIGPAISDLIGECILSAVDQNLQLPDGCFGIRFKDDYRILCHSEEQGKTIIKRLKKELDQFNLVINNEKTCIKKYPEGLQRPWITEYDFVATPLFKDGYLDFKSFKILYASTLAIHNKYPSQGVIDKFLGSIIKCRPDGEIMVKVRSNHNRKLMAAYLWQLRLVRPKSLGMILGAMEHLSEVPSLEPYITRIIKDRFKQLDSDTTYAIENSFEYLWLYYYLKTNGIGTGINKNVQNVLNDVHRQKWKNFYKNRSGASFYEWRLSKATKANLGSILNNVVIFQDS